MTLPQWDDYWRTGRVVSCPTDSVSGYTGNLRTVWEDFFGALPEGARVVDIGTGNGALPLIALETARRLGRTFDVHGVDLARIDPPRHVPDGARLFAGATFHGGVPAEAMPFAAASFHAVSGQYALEYTRHEAALAEIRRVMAADARARFVLHHASSIVVATAQESLAHARELDERCAAFSDLRAFVAAERADPPGAARLYAQITARVGRLRELAAQSRGSQLLADVLPALGNLYEMRNRLPVADFAAAVDSTERAFNAARQRLVELVDAAQDEAAIERLAGLARASGFAAVRYAPIWHDEAILVGWRLDMAAAPGQS